MSRLLKLGADPAKLYEQFREKAERHREKQPEILLKAERDLTHGLYPGEHMDVRELRRAREAMPNLVAEPWLPIDEMSHHDYKAMRMAEEQGKKPMSFAEYRAQLRPVRPNAPEPEPEVPQPESDEFCDLIALMEAREEEG